MSARLLRSFAAGTQTIAVVEALADACDRTVPATARDAIGGERLVGGYNAARQPAEIQLDRMFESIMEAAP